MVPIMVGRIGAGSAVLMSTRVLVDHDRRHLHAAEELDADLAVDALIERALDRGLDGLGVERLAVMEGDAFLQLKAPGEVVDPLPRGRQARRDAAVVGIDLGQRLGDVLLDDAADIGAAGLARVDHVGLLGEHDRDRALLRGGDHPRGKRRQGNGERQGGQAGHGVDAHALSP